MKLHYLIPAILLFGACKCGLSVEEVAREAECVNTKHDYYATADELLRANGRYHECRKDVESLENIAALCLQRLPTDGGTK